MRLVKSRLVPDKRLPIPKRGQNSATLHVLAGTLGGLNLVAQPSPEWMRSNLSDLRSLIMMDCVGHWPRLGAPDATNAPRSHFY